MAKIEIAVAESSGTQSSVVESTPSDPPAPTPDEEPPPAPGPPPKVWMTS
jgi:hypothetical protein